MQKINTLFSRKLSSALVCRVAISLCWIAGLVTGKYLALNSLWNFISIDMVTENIPLYPSGIIFMTSSLLIGYLTCIISNRLLYIYLFLKATIFAIVSTNLSVMFGSAGWLLQIMFLSAETAFVFVLLLFSIRSIGQHTKAVHKNAAYSIVALALLVSIELHIITPFTSSLLNS